MTFEGPQKSLGRSLIGAGGPGIVGNKVPQPWLKGLSDRATARERRTKLLAKQNCGGG